MSKSKPNNEVRVALVTGATGFVGSHLARRLVRDGWQVHILSRGGSRLPSAPEFAQVINLVHDGSTEGMVACVAQTKPDVVFHLASLFLSQHTITDIEPLIQSNLLFGNQLLEAMKVNEVSRIVNTGTSWQHYENKAYSPVCLYAATKQAFEAILQYYVEVHGLQAITLKLFDTYGPGDARPKLFHLLHKLARSNEPLAMSPGDQLIDLVHVDDVVKAYLVATERLLSGEVVSHESYAVSSGKVITLKEVVKAYEGATNTKLHIQWGGRPYREREVMIPWGKGKLLPKWTASTNLIDGIKHAFKNG